MSYTINTEEDARQLCSMSNKPQDIIINWNANESPTKEYVSGIIYPTLTSLDAKIHERVDNNSWSNVLRGSTDTSLKILKVRSIRSRNSLPKTISSLAVSQVVANTLTKLVFRKVHFDEIRSLELNKTLQYFVSLRRLCISLCNFGGPIDKAIKHSFSIDDTFWTISHRRSFEALMHAIIDSLTDRSLKHTRHYIDIVNSTWIGMKEKRIVKHFIASLEKVSGTRTSRLLLSDVLPSFELAGILRYLSN